MLNLIDAPDQAGTNAVGIETSLASHKQRIAVCVLGCIIAELEGVLFLRFLKLQDVDVCQHFYQVVMGGAVPVGRDLLAPDLPRMPLVIDDLVEMFLAIESPTTGQTAGALEQLAQYEASGYKIRPRALITTMYSRLLLGDLFVHGIGGAKYDQLTDAIIERFFGVRAPSYMVVSATCHLPIPREEIVHDDVRRVERHLREIRFHPEVHLDEDCLDQPEVAELVALKQRWIAATPDKKQLRQRHRDIKSVNDSLQPCLRQRREQLEQERSQLVAALRNERILRSREYAFCLFPQYVLDDWLLDIFSQ